MKKAILLLLFPLWTSVAFAQQKEAAEKLVDEGTAYHDKGDYNGAVAKYDKALELDKDNLRALAEKAYTFVTLEKYDEAVVCCKQAIEKHPGDQDLKTLYVTYGNALDGLKQTDGSIAIYDEGIKQFPDFYQLYFNKGITLASVKKYDEGILCFQRSVALRPDHGSSNNALARLLDAQGKRIPSLLAYCRLLALEPQSNRAKEDLARVQTLMNGNVEETGKRSITVHISPDMLGDTTAEGKPQENSFTSTDLILSMDAALDHDKKNKKKTPVELFTRKFENVCASLKEGAQENSGFYWSYYVPYFTEMKDKDLVETFSYIAFASSDDPDVAKWLKANKSSIDKFYDWSNAFTWKQD